MPDALSDFLNQPKAETYLALRKAILAEPEFDLFSDGVRQLEAVVESGAHDQAPEMTAALMPNWLLSARVHSLLSQSAEARGEAQRAEAERLFAEACMYGLKSTGDGTPEAPFIPLHPSDEYDLVAFLGQEGVTQRREDREGRAFDVLTCADDSEVWFDVTDAVLAMAAREMAGG
jgi:hypothetical protein